MAIVAAFPDCEVCAGTGIARAGDEEVPCRLCERRREDERAFSIVTCSNCGRSVRLVDTISYVGDDTHQVYRFCQTCQQARKRHL